MIVEWAGTSLSTGRFGESHETSEDEFLAYFGELREQGEGYIEVRVPGLDVPWLALSFKGDHAVVHKATGEESIALLVGDGSVPDGEPVEIPVFDEASESTGEFVSSLNRAWEIILAFARSGEPESLGEWWEL